VFEDREDRGEAGRRDVLSKALEHREEFSSARNVGRAKPPVGAVLVDVAEVGPVQLAVLPVPLRIEDLRVRTLAHAEPNPVLDELLHGLLDRAAEERIEDVGAIAAAGLVR
jgi:hypothetical protein